MSKKIQKKDFDLHWDEKAKFWCDQIREGKDIFRDLLSLPAFLKFIGNIKNKIVLDVGCGEGYNTRKIAQKGALITGVDISPQMIKFAKEEEKKNPLGITYCQGSWDNLSFFKKNSFDVVLSTLALMDGPGYEKALVEFHRVLRPNADLYFSILHPCFITPNYSSIKNKKGIMTHRVVNNYFKEGPWLFTWKLSKKTDKSDALDFTSMSYHRTLSTYINTLIKKGFVLKEIEEPRASLEACKKNPRLKGSRNVVTPFLFIHAKKI
jgi:ubiquinone/menaquinone biosynthesis C-methylase UbiE